MDVVEPAMVVNADGGGRHATVWHHIEYAALRMVLAVAHRVSIERLAAIGAGFMRVVGPRLRQHGRALRNLAVAFPDKTPVEREAIACAMWANMGRTFAETLALERLALDEARLEFSGRHVWEKRSQEFGPIVALTLHQGNWELLAAPFVAFGRSLSGVYKPLDNPLIDAWLIRTRSVLYPGGLLGKGDRDDEAGTGQRTARQLIDKARSNGTLCFVSDHFDRRGEPIEFMGHAGRFTTAPAAIARHVGARVWVARCLRIGTTSRFRIDVQEIAVPRTGDRKADAIALTTAVFAIFEGWVRNSPEQWMWWNTRWIAPPGGTDPALGDPPRQ